MGRKKKKICKYLFRFAATNSQRIWLMRKAGYLIGENVYIGEGFLVVDKLDKSINLTIGSNIDIAPNVTVVLASSSPNSSIHEYVEEKFAPVTIKNNVWIGTGVIILPGVTIDSFSIIAAGSVVAKDVQKNTIVGGIPARVIKEIPNKN